jgi:predicted extracellular nuclease
MVVLVGGALTAHANTTPQTLPYGPQGWTDTSLINTANDWSRVPGIVGYRGDAMVSSTGVDPQTVLADGSGTPVNVLANQTNPNTNTTGGIAEFDTLTDPVVAFQGSGTARAPQLVLSVDTSGLGNIAVSYKLRDVDGSADNSVQPVALQYRLGSTGNFTNVPAAFVADASAPGATLVTPVNALLPVSAGNQPLVQIRILTTDAAGSDEWIGVDDLTVTGSGDAAPFVQTTAPSSNAVGIPVTSDVSVTFSEPVNLTDPWYDISCPISGNHAATVSGGPTTFTLDPILDFATDETCTVTIAAASVSDQDPVDPPDTMASNYAFSFTTASPPPPAGIYFSEYIEGSSNNKALEIYNGTGAPINLAAQGYNVQMYFNGASTASLTINLTGSVASGDVFVLAQSAASAAILAEADQTNGSGWYNGDDAIALRKGATIVDVIGQIGNDPGTEWGTGLTSTADNTLRRKRSVTTGDTNGADAFDPAVEWDGFPVDTFDDLGAYGEVAPRVKATSPADGATGVSRDANLSITFSEPVDVVGAWYSIVCSASGTHAASSTGGPTTFTLDPATAFANNESCTVRIFAANVTDTDTEDPPNTMAADYVFTFQTADTFTCGDPSTLISQVQGAGLASPKEGQTVTIEGIVVGDYQDAGSFGGYYLEEETGDWDANTATSEGVFVFNTGTPVDPGDLVRVRGVVTEFSGLTEVGSVSATAICSTGNSVPATGVSLPVASLDDLEPTEGMLVHFSQDLTATEVFNLGRFGEISLSGVGRLFVGTAVAAPGAPANAVTAQNNRSRIILDDGNNQQNIDPVRNPQGGLSATNTLRVGDTLHGLDGVMDYRFGNYRIQPVGALTWDHTNPRTTAPEPVTGNLKVASFNVLNFFNGNGTHQEGAAGGFPTSRGANTLTEFNRQIAKEVSALKAMNADVVGLMEMENDSGPNSAIADLVAGLNAALGAGTYAYVDTGVIGTDEIKVALIYKPASVTPLGAWKIITTATDPRFLDTRNRPSLAQTFVTTAGAKLTVVVNHLKSKGSSCDDIGDPDTGDGSGNCNITRTNAAKALVDWLNGDPTGSGDSDYLLIGDMNSYTFEDPITAFTDGGLKNLVRQFDGMGAYSYVFNGEAGYLDHALASPSLASQTTGVAHWHINPDEPTVLDYNTEFKTANQVNTFYSDGPYRSSDHDPVIIGLNLNSPPRVSAGGPYTAAEGGSATLTASGSDDDAGTLTYAWDLDGNGTFETAGQSVQFSAASIDGPASRSVAVRVTDAGGLSATDTTTVAITNVAPTISSATAPSVNEGSPVVLTAAATDPAAADTLEFSFDCGSGFGPYGAASSVSCPTNDNGVKTVSVRARDDDGGVSGTVSVAVPVANVAPTGTFHAPASVNAGSSFTLSLSDPSDPSTADTAAGFTYAFDCGFGYGVFTSSPSAQCPTSAVGTRDVGGKIRDKDGGTSEYRGRVEVQVTAASLCALTRQYVTKNDGLANSLCVKADHGSFGAYENEVSAQRGKALTGEQADILIALARALAG